MSIRCENRVYKCHRIVLAAASEYFDTMFYGGFECFKESHLEEIPLLNIDSATFDEVLRFVYKGFVHVNDNNVYNLLHASEMLRLAFIESECVRYLKFNVPGDDAIDIYLFACATCKYELIATVRLFLLDHLDFFSRHGQFLKLSFEELCTLLVNFQPSSVKEENACLSTILQWTLCSTAASLKERKSRFTKLTQCISFQNLSLESIANSFDRNVFDYAENSCVDAMIISNSDLRVERSKSSLHVYINTLNKFNEHEDFGLQKEIHLPQTNVFSLQECNNVVNWYPSRTLKPRVSELQTVVLNDRLYCLKNVEGRYRFTVCSSADLSTDVRTLRSPLLDTSYFLNTICGHKNCIYGSYYSDTDPQKLLYFNCELDKWSTVSVMNAAYHPAITCDDSRVYVIGGRNGNSQVAAGNYEGIRDVQAYDTRVGHWEQLPKSRLRHAPFDRCCSHEGKIYVTCIATARDDLLEVYDPVSGKWDVIQLENKLNFHSENLCRLLSHDNRLWVLSNEKETQSIRVRVYNSFSQEWNSSSLLDRVAKNEIYGGPVDSEDRWFMRLLNAVSFKPL